jgi:hypothetical protein
MDIVSEFDNTEQEYLEKKHPSDNALFIKGRECFDVFGGGGGGVREKDIIRE